MKNKRGLLGILGIIAIIILAAVWIGYDMGYALTTGEEEITIKEKWVKYSGEDAKYLVSTENDQVFQITDTLIKWRFDSSNLYAQLEEGDVCTVKTQGWRLGIASDYKNILEADCG